MVSRWLLLLMLLLSGCALGPRTPLANALPTATASAATVSRPASTTFTSAASASTTAPTSSAAATAASVAPSPTPAPAPTAVPAVTVLPRIGQPDGTLAPRAPLQLTFSQPMDEASVQQALKLTPDVAGAAAWQGDTLTFTPNQPWPDATLMALTVGEAAKTAAGQPLAKPFQWSFVTDPKFAALEVSPRRDATYVAQNAVINVVFSHPPELASLQPRLHIAPAIAGKLQVDGRIATFVPTKPLPLDSAFTVTLDAGVKDSAGRTLATGTTWKFTTVPQAAPSEPRLFPAGGRIVFASLAGPHQLAFSGVGVPSVELKLYRVPSADAFLAASTAKPSGEGPPSVDTTGFTALTTWTATLPDPGEEGFKLVDVPQPDKAGIYYVDESSLGQGASGQFLIVSDQGVLVKQTADGVFVWATALADGAPRAGLPVRVYDVDGGKLAASGTTGADGSFAAPLDLPSEPNSAPPNVLVVAGTEPDVAVGGAGNEFFADGFIGNPSPYRLYVYSDRPIYRPGDTVHLRGVVRRDDDGKYALPGDATFNLWLTAPFDGKRIVERDVKPDANGNFALDVPLGANLPSGFYNYAVGTAAGQQLTSAAYGNFQVEAYRKPQYAVKVSTPAGPYVSGDTIPVTVSARYYFDQAVSDAKVRLLVTRQPWFDNGTAETMRDPEAAEQGGYSGEATGAEVLTRTGTLDANGTVAFSVPADLGKLTDSQRFTFEAVVTDAANLPVAGTASTVVHRGALTLDIAPKSYAVTTAAPVDTKFAVRDLAGKPVAGTAIACDVVQQTYDVTQEGTPKGALPLYHLVEVPAYSFTATSGAAGTATAPIRLSRPSGYRVTCQAPDGRGNTVTHTVYLWAANSSGALPPYAAAGDRLTVSADRQVYAVGDVAHIQVLSPTPDLPALVTVERGKIYSHQVIQLHGQAATFDLPITADAVPNIQVSVAVQGKGQFLSGSAALRVPATARYLNVAIKTDQPRYRPGDTATVTLTAATPDGKPAQGTFSLGMVDEAVYALARQTPPTIKAGFYAPRAIQVRTGASLRAAAGIVGAGGQGGGGGGEGGPEALRSQFPDTAYWSPNITTGPDGTATVKLTMPDSLTTWRLTAIGATPATLVGYVSDDVVSTLPFHIAPAFPRFLVAGDQLSLTALVDNATDAAVPAAVTLDAKGLTPDGPAQQQITVPAHGSQVVRWPVRVGAAGQAAITLRAEGVEVSDAVQLTLPIIPGGAAASVTKAGELGTAPTSVQLALPAAALPGSAALQLVVTPGLAAGVLSATQYLAAYPYDCAEQTASAFLPAILAKEVYAKAGLTAQEKLLPPDLDKLVAADLQQLYTLQHPDGGWNWWSYDQTDPYMTAYIVYALTEAKRLGYPVVQQNLDRGVAALQAQLNSPAAGLATRAYMLHVLALAGKPVAIKSDAVQGLYARRAEMAYYGQSYLAQLLAVGGDKADAQTILDALRAAATQTDTTASWREAIDLPPLRGSPVYSTAAVLDAFTLLAPGDPLAVKAARFLLASREGDAWSSTHDTAIAAMALNRYLLAHGDFSAQGTVTVTWNGAVIKQVDLNAAGSPLTLTLPADQIAAQNTLQLHADGSGPFFWSAALTYHTAATAPVASDQLAVSRAYTLPNGDPAPATLAPGTVVRVRLTVTAAAPLDYVQVTDYLPAGLEPLNPALATTQATAPQPESALGYDFLDLRDAGATFFITKLAPGAHTLTYDALAVSAGTFQAASAEAAQMYAPAVRAASAVSTVMVGQ